MSSPVKAAPFTSFPAGLPANLLLPAAGGEGIRLRELLGITGKKLNFIIGHDVTKKIVGRVPGGKQERLVAVYASRPARYTMIQDALGRLRGGLSAPTAVPCLEWTLLEAYDKRLTERIVAQLKDAETMGELRDGYRASLEELTAELQRWSGLDQRQRHRLVNAIFALASLLNDVTVLHRTVDAVPELAEEFGFAVAEREKEEERRAKVAEFAAMPYEGMVDWINGLKDLAQIVAEVCDAPPAVEELDRLVAAVGRLEALRPLLPDHSLEKQVDDEVEAWSDDYLRLAADPSVAWLLPSLEAFNVARCDQPPQTEAELIRLKSMRLLLADYLADWRSKAAAAEQLAARVAELHAARQSADPATRRQALQEHSAASAASQASTEQLLEAEEKIFTLLQSEDLLNAVPPAAPLAAAVAPAAPLAGPAPAEPGSELEPAAALPVATTAPAAPAPATPSAPAVAGAVEPPQLVPAMEQPAAAPALAVPQPTSKESQPPAADREEAAAEVAPPPAPPAPASVEPTALDETLPAELPVELPPTGPNQPVWDMVAAGRPGLAYQLARAGLGDNWQPAPWALGAATIAPAVRFEMGDIAGCLKDFYLQADAAADLTGAGEENYAYWLLVAAATLRPALIAPGTGAAELLDAVRLPDGLGGLYRLCRTVVEYGNLHQPLEAAALKQARSQGAWQEDLAALQDEIRTWLAQAPNITYKYIPAKKVWRRFLESGAPLPELLAPLAAERPTSTLVEATRERLRELSDPDRVDAMIERYDTEIRGARRSGETIGLSARDNLHAYVGEALTLANRWLALVAARPGDAKQHRHRLAEELRAALTTDLAQAGEELAGAVTRAGETPLAAALAICQRAVANIAVLFDPATPLEGIEPAPGMLLHGELLGLPQLVIEAGWSAPTVAAADLARLTAPPDWDAYYAAAAAAMNHETTARLLELARAGLAPGLDGEARSLGRGKALKESRETVALALDEARKDVEAAFALGGVDETASSNFLARLALLEAELPTMLRCHEALAGLEELQAELDRLRSARRAELEQELAAAALAPTSSAVQLISAKLAAGDFLSAGELLLMARDGQELEEAPLAASPFAEFQALRPELEKALAKNSALTLAGRVKSREPLDSIDLPTRLEPEEAVQGTLLLEAWHGLARSHKVGDGAAVRGVLTGLGFGVQQVRVDKRADFSWCEAVCDPVHDRALCPVSLYGSGAAGHYRIICAWDRPPVETLLAEAAKLPHGAATLVFWFGVMPADKRRDLAVACRERGRTLVVLDDVLLAFLAMRGGSRMAALYRVALPYTFYEPYMFAGGLVPEEMFYGRQREREAVMARGEAAASVVYGGRQLGKTALLRDVERRFTDRRQGQIAIWIDLDGEGIAKGRSIDDIWQLLAKEFAKRDIVDAKVGSEPGRLLDAVEEWLVEEPRRRILLMLDEADLFLESDGNDQFARTARLKRLMDRTDKRFKVVFAGLHNVQRSTMVKNDPLAHFGDAVRIGPLLAPDERRAAQELVVEPLAALGFTFASQELVWRIISQALYSPALIQLYCNKLLKHMTGRIRRGELRNGPPYAIAEQDVLATYQQSDLREQIRYRFNLTLKLDGRYEVIAYCLANDNLVSGAVGRDLAWLKQEALYWWGEGFKHDLAGDRFATLLMELIGLGVLREKDGLYSFRSPHVAALMGSQEQIYAALTAPREMPREYEPGVFRPSLRRQDGRRSPLSAQELAWLAAPKNAAAVICGCKAAGLEELPEFLADYFGAGAVVTYAKVEDLGRFQARLEDIRQRDKGATTLYLVGPDCAWDRSWVEAAREWLARRKSKSAFAKFVFLAGPEECWRQLGAGGWPELVETSQELMVLRPWHGSVVRQWLEECGLGPVEGQVEALEQATGNWPALLYRFHARVQGDAHRWQAALAELAATPDGLGSLAEFGLAGAVPLRVLAAHSQFGPASRADLEVVCDGETPAGIAQALRWGRLCGLLVPAGPDSWQVDPLVARLVAAGEGA